jgi:AcrR family transcriptional regulator
MEQRDPLPARLPLLEDRCERRDAAENRERILAAARGLLETRGVTGLSMDAVAKAANVGKGTIFRRFGDRAGLIHALLDGYMRDFQDAFLSGPPPLGPGAPATERLEAFAVELLALQKKHLVLALAGEALPSDAPRGVYGALRMHVEQLLQKIDPRLDSEVLAAMILGALAPSVVESALHGGEPADVEALQTSARALLRGICGEAFAPRA